MSEGGSEEGCERRSIEKRKKVGGRKEKWTKKGNEEREGWKVGGK